MEKEREISVCRPYGINRVDILMKSFFFIYLSVSWIIERDICNMLLLFASY